MLLTWKKVESLEKPLEVDCMLSNEDVYYRKDIVQDEDGKYTYQETLLGKEFRFDILDTQEYIKAINEKIDEINGQLHITKLDFYNNFCKPVGISYDDLVAKIVELDMKAEWELCNHVYYGVIKPFLNTLPLGKTDEEIISIFENLTPAE
jgi:hypothetical protein